MEGIIRHEEDDPGETTVLTSGHAVPPANDIFTRHHLDTTNKIHVYVASSPGSPIFFSTHAREEGEPGTRNHVCDVKRRIVVEL